MNKSIKEKFKQITLTMFAIGLIGIGYINFNINQDNFEKQIASKNDKENIGDVELVSSSSVEENVSDTTKQVVSDNLEIENNKEDEVLNYFTSSKIERNKMYSEILENYQNIVDSSTISNEQKAIAINEITKINNEKNSIMISENLIKNKGFEDVLILINNNIVSIVVMSEVLTVENIAQIQNIASRQLQISIDNINITNKY